MTRQVVLDTETTGLEPRLGHRIIEIAAVEVQGRCLTDNRFHRYLNPDREIDAGAMDVHGISLDFLLDKPRFGDVAREFLDFIREAELIIHNAGFDVGFLDHELALIGLERLDKHCVSVIDTLKLARDLHPGQKNNLDALCRRYGIDNSARALHGAMLDAELLAEVYLAMTRGQDSLDMEIMPRQASSNEPAGFARDYRLNVLLANSDEQSAHRNLLGQMGKVCPPLWDSLDREG
jgi:DNA polymerase III subunit epsilon